MVILDFLKRINFHEFYFHYYLFKELVVVNWNFKFLLGLSFIRVRRFFELSPLERRRMTPKLVLQALSPKRRRNPFSLKRKVQG